MYNVRFSYFHSRKCKNIFYVFCLLRQSHSSIQKGTTHKSFFLSCAPFLPICLSTPLCCMEKSLSCWPKLLTCCSFLQTSKSLFLTGISPLIFSRKRALESAESPYFSMVLWSLDIVEVIGSSPTNPTTSRKPWLIWVFGILCFVQKANWKCSQIWMYAVFPYFLPTCISCKLWYIKVWTAFSSLLFYPTPPKSKMHKNTHDFSSFVDPL